MKMCTSGKHSNWSVRGDTIHPGDAFACNGIRKRERERLLIFCSNCSLQAVVRFTVSAFF